MTAIHRPADAITVTPKEEPLGASFVALPETMTHTRTVVLDYCTRICYITGVGCACASNGESEHPHGAY